MLGHFPTPYPDELFYSLCARYSDRMGYGVQTAVFRDLFGYNGPTPSIALPHRLATFVASLPPGHSYILKSLIDRYTLFPYYSAFFPADKAALLRAAMTAGDGRLVATRLGSSPGRIPPPSRLRFCPHCVQEDRRRYGEAYWHRLHQLPGVEICLEHKVWLLESDVPAQGNPRLYRFVSAEEAVPRQRHSTPFKSSLQHWTFLARESAWLLTHPSLSLKPEETRQRYKVALTWRGLASPGGISVYHQKLARQFKLHYPPGFLERLHCDFEAEQLGNWLRRLLNRPDAIFHPLYHLLLMNFLGVAVDEFAALPTRYHPFGRGPWPCLNPVCKNYRQPVIQAVTISYNKAGQPRGAFACHCGFAYFRVGPDQSPEDCFRRNSRVKAYGAVWESALQALWQDERYTLRQIARRLGAGQTAIAYQAARLGLPDTPERRIRDFASLNKSACLPKRDKEAEYRIKRDRYRAEWLAALKADAGIGVTQFISRHKRVYTWLRRNDWAWLQERKPERW